LRVKRLVELTIEDVEAHPVWRYEGGQGAEALAAPVDRRALSQSDDEIFLAATEYELFDATKHAGFCFPADGTAIDYLQPVILTPAGQVTFWFDGPVSPETLSKQWEALGREPAQIFPVAFRCLVPVDGRTVSGRIDGIESSDRLAPRPGTEAPTRRTGVGTGETRTARRRSAEMTVEFRQGSLQGTGVIGDVSRRGMYVRSSWIPGAGPVLRLTVHLPGGRKLDLTGRVVRRVDEASPSVAPSGFGLRLLDEWPGYDELFHRKRVPKK
jgi:hypothetical protein